VPYMIWETVTSEPARQLDAAERHTRLANTLKALRVGLEKVISTMGIHELRGYGRSLPALA